MELTVIVNGGIAGFVNDILARVDSHNLINSQRKEIENLLEKSDFFKLPELIPKSDIYADSLQYKIVVKEQNRSKNVVFYDEQSPKTKLLRQLKDKIISLK